MSAIGVRVGGVRFSIVDSRIPADQLRTGPGSRHSKRTEMAAICAIDARAIKRGGMMPSSKASSGKASRRASGRGQTCEG